MQTRCLPCRGPTDNVNETQAVASNGRLMIRSQCAVCGRGKSRFIKCAGPNGNTKAPRKKKGGFIGKLFGF